jgi:drug/metabolite transporter (DMT)-like permease
MKTRTKAELILLSCTIIWGGTFVIVKGGLDDSPPVFFVAIRFVIATLLFLPFVARGLPSMSKISFKGGLVIGTLLFLGFVSQTIGLQYTTASKSGFITGLLVVFTPMFQIAIERKLPKIGNVIGVILVTVGLYFLTSPAGSEFNVGDGLTLICAAIFGLYIVLLDVYSREGNVWHMNFMQFTVTALGALAVSFAFEDISVNLTPSLIGAIGYLALLATLYTITVQARYQKDTTPTRAAIIFSVEPVFAAGFAYLVSGEMIGTLGIFGGILVVGGLIVSELSDVLFKRRKSVEPAT